MAEVNTGGGGGKHKGGKPKAKKMSTKMDMTPMVDLAFLLLTFFMLTTQFSKPQTMEIVMPDKDKETPKEDQDKINVKDVMNLIMGENNRIYYYTQEDVNASPEVKVASYTPNSNLSIRKILVKQHNENIARNGGKDQFMVLIKAADGAKYKNMVDIFDEMNITAMNRYAMVDITPAETEMIKNVKE
ncbi:MAG: biopolymer transporter ExbD [Sphingobacteriales bacterium]|nr:MAG: biopolymer transporter ExbD [Sphingobacteriales bacterium]